jgi:hypothetical protein
MSSLTALEALNRVVEDTVVNLRLVGARTLANLYENGSIKTATKTTLDWDALAGGGGVAWESTDQDGANTATDVTVPAKLFIGSHRIKDQFSVSRVALREAATLAPDDLKDLFGAHIRSGLTHILREINRVIWVGDGTPATGNVVGLNRVMDATFAYAGVDPAAYPEWQAVALTNATPRALTRDLLLDYEEAIINRETYYNSVVTSPSAAKNYTKLFDTIAGGSSVTKMVDDKKQPAVDLGHGARYYNGLPIVEDPMCPAGQFTTLNLDEIFLYSFDVSTKVDDPDDDSRIISSKTMGLNVHLSKLPSNNSAVHRFELFVIPQLQVKNRKAVQAIRNLS